MSEPIRTIKLTDEQYNLLRKEIFDVDVAHHTLSKIVESILESYAEKRRLAFDVCRKMANCTIDEEIVVNWLTRSIEVVPHRKLESWRDVIA